MVCDAPLQRVAHKAWERIFEEVSRALAAQYCDGVLLERARRRFAPLPLLRGCVRGRHEERCRHAGVSGTCWARGLVVTRFFTGLFGYLLPAREVLGWWYVPLGCCS